MAKTYYTKHQLKTIQKIGAKTLIYGFCADFLYIVLLVFSIDQRFLRTCLHKKCVRIFEHNFVADKAKISGWAVAWQGFLTQSAAKFAEKTYSYDCEDRFLHSFPHNNLFL